MAIFLPNRKKHKTKRIFDISLRDEMISILGGDEYGESIGHWVIYRSVDPTHYSEDYNAVTKESYGSPPYEYTDKVILTFAVMGASLDKLLRDHKEFGQLSQYSAIYYFKYVEDPLDPEYLRPKSGDIIFEVDYQSEVKPTIEGGKLTRGSRYIYYDKDFLNKYHVGNSVPLRLDYHGRIEYFLAGCVERNSAIYG